MTNTQRREGDTKIRQRGKSPVEAIYQFIDSSTDNMVASAEEKVLVLGGRKDQTKTIALEEKILHLIIHSHCNYMLEIETLTTGVHRSGKYLIQTKWAQSQCTRSKAPVHPSHAEVSLCTGMEVVNCVNQLATPKP
jgi:hypothetical protein